MLALPLGIAWLSAVLLVLLDGRKRWVGLLGAAALAATLAALFRLGLNVMHDETQTLVTGGWPEGIGIVLRADLLGVTFALVSVAVLLAALLYEVSVGVREQFFPSIVLFMAAGLTGLFLTGDAFNFYVFFEVSMTSAFVLASYGQERREVRAALIFTISNLLGTVLFLSAIATLYRLTGTLEMQAIAARSQQLETPITLLIAALLLAAFSVKLGLFPFHFWLPLVYHDTRPSVAAVLSGAIANIGSYGLLRFAGDILPAEREQGAVVLLVLGTASILYGAYQAAGSRPVNTVLAYSSVSQAGYIMVSLGLGASAGYAAVVIYAVINALNKTVLFLSSRLRGWFVGATFAIAAFSVAGVPPAAGFLGKLAIFRAGIAADTPVLVLLVFVGSALAFVYMFQNYQRIFWVQRSDETVSPLITRLFVFSLSAIILLLGLWPGPLLDVSQQIAQQLAGG